MTTPIVGTALTYTISSYDDSGTWIAGLLCAAFALRAWWHFKDKDSSLWSIVLNAAIALAFLILSLASFFVRDGKVTSHLSYILFWAMVASAAGTVLWALLRDRDKIKYRRAAGCATTTAVLSICALGANYWLYSDAATSNPTMTVRIDVALWWILFATAGFALATGALGIVAIREWAGAQRG